MTRLRKLRRILSITGLILVCWVLLLVLVVYLALNTDLGREQIRRVALDQIAGLFAPDGGGVEFARLEGNLFSRFTIVDLVVRDNGGGPMVKVDRVEASLDIWGLFDKKVRVKDVRAHTVDVKVVYDEVGTRYPIVLEDPDEPVTEEDSAPWIVEIEDVSVERVRFDWGEVDASPTFTVREGFLKAGLLIDEEKIKIFVKEAGGLPTGISVGGLVRGELTYTDDNFAIDWAEVRLGASRLLVSGEIREFEDVYVDLSFSPGYVAASDLRRALPDLPLLTSLVVDGSLRGRMGDLALDLGFEAPGYGHARVRYTMNLLDPLATWGLSLVAESLDLPGWVGLELPHTRLSLQLGAVGTGFGDGDIERFGLTLKGAVEGYPDLEMGLVGSYRRGVFRLDALQLDTSGGETVASGLYDTKAERGGFTARLNIPEIAALPLPFSGARGALSGSVALALGPEESLARFDLVATRARFEEYAAGRLLVRGEGTLVEGRPTGAAEISAEGLSLSGTHLSSARASVSLAPEPDAPIRFDARATMASGEWAQARGKVTLGEESTLVLLEGGALALSEGEALRIVPGAEIEIGEEAVDWRDILLRAGSQGEVSSKGSYRLKDGNIAGEVKARELDLSAVLGAAVPPELNLDGKVSLDLMLEGPASSPRFQLGAQLEDGSLAKLEKLQVERLMARYNGKQLELDVTTTKDKKPFLYGSGRIPLDLYRGTLGTGEFIYSFQLDALDLEKIEPLLPESLSELRGKVTLSASTSGTGRSPRINASFDLEDGYYSDWEDIDITGKISVSEEATQGRLALRLGDHPLGEVRGRVDLSWEKLLDLSQVSREEIFETPLALQVEIEESSFTNLIKELPQAYRSEIPFTEGALESRLSILGTIGNPEIEFTGELRRGTLVWEDTSVAGVGISWRSQLSEGELDASGSVYGPGVEELSFDARMPITAISVLDIWEGNLPSADSLLATPLELMLSLKGVEPRELPLDALGVEPDALDFLKQGKLGAEVFWEGTLLAPRIRYILALEDAVFVQGPTSPYGMGPLFVALEGSYGAEGFTSSVSVSDRGKSSLAGEISLQLPIQDAILLARGELSAESLAPAFHLALYGEGIELAPLVMFLKERQDAEGRLGLRVSVDGPLRLSWPAPLPPVQVELWSGELRLGGATLASSKISAQLKDGLASWELRADGKESGWVRSAGEIPLDLSLEELFSDGTPLSATLEANSFDVSFLSLLVPGTRRLGGKLSTDGLSLSGTLGAPSLEGPLLITEGEVAIRGLDTYLRDFTLRANLKHDRADVEELIVQTGYGSASLSGEIQLEDGWPESFSLDLSTRDLEIPYDGTTLANLDTKITLQGEISDNQLLGEVTIAESTLKLPERLTTEEKNLMSLQDLEDVVITTGGAPSIEEEEQESEISEEEPFFYSIAVEIPDRFYVRGSPFELSYVDIELGGKLRLEDLGSGLSIVGSISILSGYVSLWDTNFQLSKDSKLTFIGADLDPRLAIEASASATANQGGAFTEYQIKVKVTGTASEPKVSITSEPFLEESRIAQLLLTGSLDSAETLDGEQARNEMGEKLGALMGMHLMPLLQKGILGEVVRELRLDVFRLDLQKFEVGKYFYLDKKKKKKCYLGYVHRFSVPEASALGGGPNQHEGDFVCRIGGNWILDGRGGAPKHGNAALGIDILWSKDY